MNESAADAVERLTTRLVELESRYLHWERTLDALDQVMRDQQRQIETLERKISALERDFNALSNAPGESLEPRDEKPPHY